MNIAMTREDLHFSFKMVTMKTIRIVTIVTVVAIQGLAQRNLGPSCPEKDGRYPTSTCDGYIECRDGLPSEKLCPDGLLFNPASGPQAFPCQYPLDVDCTGREQTQPAQATDECPHQFGYFRMGDATSCGQFKNCVAGRGFVFDCPEGLAFNGDTYRCDWPDQVPTCDAEGFLGFTCPQDGRSFGLGEEEFRFFRSPNDCQRYFVCVNGRPRLNNCGEGRAFNDLINACDGVENVTGCVGGAIGGAPFRNYRI
ncbi:protein obstructor-E-like [Tribolium madens]|uniref:protein obstructor-E-like n=1 Tax=Tribolium madens TaxID=41895 RepID=UPI001CF74DA7|nr:protein obstructor-E-like [Tribolium madens]